MRSRVALTVAVEQEHGVLEGRNRVGTAGEREVGPLVLVGEGVGGDVLLRADHESEKLRGMVEGLNREDASSRVWERDHGGYSLAWSCSSSR